MSLANYRRNGESLAEFFNKMKDDITRQMEEEQVDSNRDTLIDKREFCQWVQNSEANSIFFDHRKEIAEQIYDACIPEESNGQKDGLT